MSFKFNLFRVLTSLNLLVAGFFCVGLFSSYIASRQFAALVLLILAGAVLIHTWLSMRLQRTLTNPAYELGENTPGGIRIMSGFSLLHAFIYLCCGALMIIGGYMMTADMMKEALKQAEAQQAGISAEDLKTMLRVFGPLFLLHGLTVLVNVILSISFLQNWKYAQERQQNAPPREEDEF